jgi:hypothetical protein
MCTYVKLNSNKIFGAFCLCNRKIFASRLQLRLRLLLGDRQLMIIVSEMPLLGDSLIQVIVKGSLGDLMIIVRIRRHVEKLAPIVDIFILKIDRTYL